MSDNKILAESGQRFSATVCDLTFVVPEGAAVIMDDREVVAYDTGDEATWWNFVVDEEVPLDLAERGAVGAVTKRLRAHDHYEQLGESRGEIDGRPTYSLLAESGDVGGVRLTTVLIVIRLAERRFAAVVLQSPRDREHALAVFAELVGSIEITG